MSMFRLSACGVLFCMLSLVAQEKKSPTSVIPNERKDKFAVSRHEKFVEIAKKGEVDLLFIGDSITQGWEGAGKNVWAENYGKLKAANFGIGGDRTEHILWRITAGKELEGIKPKLIVMMIGTNNTGSNSSEEIAQGVKAILDEFAKQKPEAKVLLLGVFPRATGGVTDKAATFATKEQMRTGNNKKTWEVNELIKKFDDGKKVFFLDISEKFLDKEGNLPKEIMPDWLHLSEKGYKVWADSIKDKLTELLK